MFPIYISNPAYTYACMTSFNTFCFLQHLRWTAFVPISPDLDGIASSSSSSPRTSGEQDEAAQHEMIERGQHGRHDSTSSNGSAHEEDPALGRRTEHPVKFGEQSLQTTLRKKFKRTIRTWKQVTWRDGLAESFNLYAQNVPTVVTLVPRAGLALALLLAFSPGIVGASAGAAFREFFLPSLAPGFETCSNHPHPHPQGQAETPRFSSPTMVS